MIQLGTLVNSVTLEPIGRALVYSERFATLTDDHPHFELSMPEPPQSPEARWIANGQPVRVPNFRRHCQ
jgi:hypothetical protein